MACFESDTLVWRALASVAANVKALSCHVQAPVRPARPLIGWLGPQELQREDEGQSGAAAGSLSALFRRVVSVCQSQFVVIGQVFPQPLVAKVTRLLLQRILNDPVYGVQVGRGAARGEGLSKLGRSGELEDGSCSQLGDAARIWLALGEQASVRVKTQGS